MIFIWIPDSSMLHSLQQLNHLVIQRETFLQGPLFSES